MIFDGWRLLILTVFFFGVSWLFTSIAIRILTASQFWDVPNSRSSHQVPIIRGGGIGFVIAISLGIIGLTLCADLPIHYIIVMAVVPSAVALTGLLDDAGHVAVGWRLLVQSLSIFIVLYIVSDLPTIFPMVHINKVVVFVFYFLVGVWFINLFNFMDGIDGIVSLEVVFILTGLLFITGLNSHLTGSVLFLVIIAASVAGFLIFNFPPAKVFMGDVGSGFLGIIVFVVSLDVIAQLQSHILIALILAGFFIVDSTYTLLFRLFNRMPVFQAHRSHMYQILSRRWQSHGKVLCLLLCVNVFWLLPLAVLSELYPNIAVLFLLFAWLPLVYLCRIVGAGRN